MENENKIDLDELFVELQGKLAEMTVEDFRREFPNSFKETIGPNEQKRKDFFDQFLEHVESLSLEEFKALFPNSDLGFDD